ncbi:hypothetical protein SMACR_08945 [Sordaria macrospora]|uniref:WGS project CABT00000000 data, contig 2.70 n=2 Tax=Sordaria macrospora TaxID=5147 RepID=F7WB66_SORMK|nr:uncharacterized protein SMAC_08945 [Sordaria macrospora k-hell]KAA8631091.1 hypothetical protein SMACR_08945 [Sordaria macrospora]KAH7629319.1 hypothetical protein B0T09DRAFT_358292 [Sordaria sp. MPI-SDFR-AT-0083]WPJ63926.1 hypothetical protein SMAC4_08945 [Sordaria macrospora]CCC14358.1 unnamed protein product [Sordaria macrospora k-hell]
MSDQEEATPPPSAPPQAIANINRYREIFAALVKRDPPVLRNALYQLYIWEGTRDSEALQARIHELLTANQASEDKKSDQDPKSVKAVESTNGDDEASPPNSQPNGSSTKRAREETRTPEEERKRGIMQLNRESSTWEEEAFIDIDKHESKELDTPFIRVTFTNGFSWTCCGQPGGRPGCQWSRHKAYDEDTGESNDNNDSDEIWLWEEEGEEEDETDEGGKTD